MHIVCSVSFLQMLELDLCLTCISIIICHLEITIPVELRYVNTCMFSSEVFSCQYVHNYDPFQGCT